MECGWYGSGGDSQQKQGSWSTEFCFEFLTKLEAWKGWRLCGRSRAAFRLTTPLVGEKYLWGGKVFVFIICLTQIFLGTAQENFCGELPKSSPVLTGLRVSVKDVKQYAIISMSIVLGVQDDPVDLHHYRTQQTAGENGGKSFYVYTRMLQQRYNRCMSSCLFQWAKKHKNRHGNRCSNHNVCKTKHGNDSITTWKMENIQYYGREADPALWSCLTRIVSRCCGWCNRRICFLHFFRQQSCLRLPVQE